VFNLTSARRRLKLSEERGKEIYSMAKLVYGLNQSLDGYVDHMKLGPPAPAAFVISLSWCVA
jgi:hypothetical protein